MVILAGNSHAESGLPPWHTIVFLLSVSALCIGGIPTFDSLDEIAKEETFLNVVFPEYFSPIGVAIIRLLFGMVMLFDACYQFLCRRTMTRRCACLLTYLLANTFDELYSFRLQLVIGIRILNIILRAS